MQSLECMTSYIRKSIGDVPPPLIGPTTTFLPPHHIYLFGGRTVDTRRVTAGLFVLDLRTLTWTRIKEPPRTTASNILAESTTETLKDQPAWPNARYFHTTDVHHNQLIVFGGMGSSASSSSTTTTATASTITEQPCVLSDLWIFDISSSKWSCYPADVATSKDSSIPPPVTASETNNDKNNNDEDDDDGAQSDNQAMVVQGRYAHLSAVVPEGDHLVVIGGQNISNAYVHQQAIFHIPTRRWESVSTRPASEIRGSYRSVAVSRSALEEVVPHAGAPVAAEGGRRSVERQLTYSRPRRHRCHHGPTGASSNDANQREEQGQREPSTAPDSGDIYLFSNSNFTDVQRELHSIAVTDSSNRSTSSPHRQVSTTSTNLTSYLPPSPGGHAHAHSSAMGQQQPPGLRFPFAAHVGHHLVLGGTYLSQSAAQFAVWALNFRTWRWEKISAHVLEGSGAKVVRRGESGEMVMAGGGAGLEETGLPGGSWNRAVYWPGAGTDEAEMIDVTDGHVAAGHGKEKQRQEQGGKLLVFGNRYRNLQDDYELRAINFDHVAFIELEVFGIYQPPLRHPLLQHRVQQQQQQQEGSRPDRWVSNTDEPSRAAYALGLLHSGFLADLNVVCEEARVIRCSSRVLEERWSWFREERARYRLDSPKMATESRTARPPRTLHISESYPIVTAFLEYLYTLDLATQLQHRPPVLSGLLMLAKQYGMEHLERLVVHAMHEALDESTALGIYEAATLCECPQLQVRALKVVLAMQKRAGKGSNHRRQQSSGPAAAMTAGGHGTTLPHTAGPPASGGDSTRTVNDNTATAGSVTDYHHVYTTAGQSVDVASPSTYAVHNGLAAEQHGKSSGGSPSPAKVGESEAGCDIDGTPTRETTQSMNDGTPSKGLQSSKDELEVDYDPPTYRARRRSASVASVHHFSARGEAMRNVTSQGEIIHRAAPPSIVPPNGLARSSLDDNTDRKKNIVTRKMTSMSSLFSFAHRDDIPVHSSRRPSTSGTTRLRTKLQLPIRPFHPAVPQAQRDQARRVHLDGQRDPRGGGHSTSDSSTPSSPVTPTGPDEMQHGFPSPFLPASRSKESPLTFRFAAPVLG